MTPPVSGDSEPGQVENDSRKESSVVTELLADNVRYGRIAGGLPIKELR